MCPILSHGLSHVPHAALSLILSYDGRDFVHQSLRFRDLTEVGKKIAIGKWGKNLLRTSPCCWTLPLQGWVHFFFSRQHPCKSSFSGLHPLPNSAPPVSLLSLFDLYTSRWHPYILLKRYLPGSSACAFHSYTFIGSEGPYWAIMASCNPCPIFYTYESRSLSL